VDEQRAPRQRSGSDVGDLRIELLRIDADGTVQAPRARVLVRGEVDLVTAEQMSLQLTSLVETLAESDDEVVQLDVDMDGVPFCDVAGLNALLTVDRLLRACGGRLIIHHPCRPLRIMTEALPELDRLQFA